MKNSVFIGRKISEETRTWLIQNKVCFEQHQLIQIELNKPDLAEFESIKYKPKQFLISSQWAAKWLHKYALLIGLRNQDIIFCLSEKQKEILIDIGNDILVSEQQNVQCLADLVIKRNKPGIVVFLHGNQSLNRKETGSSSLYSGYKSIEVYRNYPVIKKINKEFGLYVFFSPSGVKNFKNNGNVIPENAEIIAIGETTAGACSSLFNNRIYISKKQDELSVIQFAVERNKQVVKG